WKSNNSNGVEHFLESSIHRGRGETSGRGRRRDPRRGRPIGDPRLTHLEAGTQLLADGLPAGLPLLLLLSRLEPALAKIDPTPPPTRSVGAGPSVIGFTADEDVLAGSVRPVRIPGGVSRSDFDGCAVFIPVVRTDEEPVRTDPERDIGGQRPEMI